MSKSTAQTEHLKEMLVGNILVSWEPAPGRDWRSSALTEPCSAWSSSKPRCGPFLDIFKLVTGMFLLMIPLL